MESDVDNTSLRQDYIENAPEGSWRIAYFAALTRGKACISFLPDHQMLGHQGFRVVIISSKDRNNADSVFVAGPLRSFLINYYALTSDHTQRLLSVRANGKFSDPKATSETPLSRREDLKHVVSELRVGFLLRTGLLNPSATEARNLVLEVTLNKFQTTLNPFKLFVYTGDEVFLYRKEESYCC